MKLLLVALLLMYPLSVGAETYEWTDQNGTVNFTEDLGKVPKMYRKKVRVIGGDESGTPVVIEAPESTKGKVKDAPKAKKAASKEEAAWRNDYAVAKVNVEVTEQNIEDLNGRMADTSKMSRTEFLSLQNTLKQAQYRLQEQKKRLEALRAAGEREGFTPEQK